MEGLKSDLSRLGLRQVDLARLIDVSTRTVSL
jgi:DNA-binding XRE family transcriptional regulator